MHEVKNTWKVENQFPGSKTRGVRDIEIKIIGFTIKMTVVSTVHYTEHVAVMSCVSNFRNPENTYA